jgi:hypothetical protein
MTTVAIDLTPIRPLGENGGAKHVLIELMNQFIKGSHSYQVILLTA